MYALCISPLVRKEQLKATDVCLLIKVFFPMSLIMRLDMHVMFYRLESMLYKLQSRW